MQNYLIINNSKIYIEVMDEKFTFYKQDNDSKKILSIKEEKEIRDMIKINNYDILFSDILDNIIKENNKFNEKNELIDLLKKVEKLIPINYRTTFYENIKKLQISFTDDDIEKNGCYMVKENKIEISIKHLENDKNISEEKYPGLYYRKLKRIIAHELFHMASSKYDIKNDITYTGFNKFPLEDDLETNMGLTEAFTSIMESIVLPDEIIDFSNNYFYSTQLLLQLIKITNLDIIAKSYYLNMGTKLIEDELNKINNDQDKTKRFLRFFELSYICTTKKLEHTYTTVCQNELIELFNKKLNILLKNNIISYEEAQKNIIEYEKLLITPEKIKLKNNNINNFVKLDLSLEYFKYLKQSFNIDETKKNRL